jgi:hypothetical protein
MVTIMGIGKRKTANSGERPPKLVWDCKACQLYTEVRVQDDNGNWHSEQTQIALSDFRGIPDLSTLEIGWIAYLKGVGLDAELVRVRSGKDHGDAPSADHREGLRLIWSVAGIVYEMISTAGPVWNAVDTLDNEFLAGVAERPGRLPIVGITDTTKITLSNNVDVFAPVFGIIGWQKRPPELPVEGIPLVKRQKRKDNGAAASASPAPYVRPKPKDMDDEIPF